MFNTDRTFSMAQRRRTREQWRRLVEGWPRSGLTQAQYCAHHGISVTSFHRWREVLRHGPSAGIPTSGPEAGERVRLLPVELLSEPIVRAAEAALTLVLDERLCLQIGPDFDGETLKRVVALLQEGLAA
jgi:transposase-like protein